MKDGSGILFCFLKKRLSGQPDSTLRGFLGWRGTRPNECGFSVDSEREKRPCFSL